MLIDFFDVPTSRKELKSVTTGKNEYSKEEYIEVPNKLPTLFRFAMSIGVNKLTVLRWTEEYEDFCNAYNSIKDLQKEFLTTNGLRGLYPPSSFIFVAKNVTDMTDEKKVDVTSKGESLGYVILPPEVPLNAPKK